MRSTLIIVFAVASLAAAVKSASAESLGSAARRERERRQKNEETGVKPVRTITHDEVRTKEEAPVPMAGASGSGTRRARDGATSGEGASRSDSSTNGDDPPVVQLPPVPAESSSPSSASSSHRAQDEQRWRARARGARERLEAARKRLQRIPPIIYSNSNGQPSAAANSSYADAQREVKAAEKALADLEEEARRAGALPGWLR